MSDCVNFTCAAYGDNCFKDVPGYTCYGYIPPAEKTVENQSNTNSNTSNTLNTLEENNSTQMCVETVSKPNSETICKR